MKKKTKYLLMAILAPFMVVSSIVIGTVNTHSHLVEATEKTYQLVLDKNHANPLLNGSTCDELVETNVGTPHVLIRYKNLERGNAGGFVKVKAREEMIISNPELKDHPALNRITGIKSITVDAPSLSRMSLTTHWEKHPCNSVEYVTYDVESNVPIVFDDVKPNYFQLLSYAYTDYEINSIKIVYSCTNEIEKLLTTTPGFEYQRVEGGYAITQSHASSFNFIIPKMHNGEPVVKVNFIPRCSGYFNLLYLPDTVVDATKWSKKFKIAIYGGTTNLLDVRASDIIYGVKDRVVCDDGNEYLIRDLGNGKTALINDIPDRYEFFTIPESISFNNEVIRVIGVAPYGIVSKEKLKKLIVPDYISELHLGAFYNNYNLEDVQLGNNLKMLPRDLFGPENKIKTLIIPEGVEKIYDTKIEYSLNLQYVVIPSTCTYFIFDDQPDTSHTIYFFRGHNPDLKLDVYHKPKNVYFNYIAHGQLDNGLTYAIFNKNNEQFATFIRYESDAETLTVPGKINHEGKEYRVDGMEKNTGPGNYNLKTINIMEGVGTVDMYFFEKCPNIKEVFISIGTSMYSMSGDTTYYFSKGNDEGKEFVKDSMNYMNTCVTVSDFIGIKGITHDGFKFAICENKSDRYAAITGYNGQEIDITIPKEITDNGTIYPVKYICNHAFDNDNLNSIRIQTNIEYIDMFAFNESIYLLFDGYIRSSYDFNETERFHRTVTHYAGIQGKTNDGLEYAIYNKGDTQCAAILGRTNSNPNLVIPEKINHNGVDYTVTEIVSNAFNHDESLQSVHLPDTITYLRPFSFSNCYNLTSINLPNTLHTLGLHCLQATGFTTITLPSSLTYIDEGAFCDSALREIFIPATVNYIGIYVFDYRVEIRCEATSKPSAWDEYWTNSDNIKWGQNQ